MGATRDVDPEPSGRAASGSGSVHAPGPVTRRATLNAVALMLGEIAGKVATLAYTVAAVRTLTQEDFGAFAYAIAFSLLVATLPSWGFDPLLTQRGSRDPSRLPALLSETLVWRTGIAVPVFAAAGIAGFALAPSTESGITLLVVLGATLVDAFSHAGRAVAAAKQRQVGMSIALVVQRFATASLAIGGLASGLGLIGLSVAYLAGTLVGMAGVVFVVRGMGVSLDMAAVNREGLMRTGKLSIALGVDVLVAMALFRIDQIILGAIKGEGEVGAYAAAYRLVEAVLFFSWAMTRAIFPVMSAATEAWRVRRGVEQGLAALAVIYVPLAVGLWIEARPGLDLLYGAPYSAVSLGALRWLAPTPLLFAIGFVGSSALIARGRRTSVLVSSLVAAAYNVVLNVILIPRLGGTGAAIATTTAYGLEAFIVVLMLRPHVGWIRLHRALLLPGLATVLMTVALLGLTMEVIPETLLGAAVYLVAWLALTSWRAPEQIAVARSLMPWRR